MMSVDANIFKVIPQNLGMGFGFCVYGEVSDEIIDLAESCNFKIENGEKYTNFFPTVDTDFNKMFFEKKFKYMDGFSPNLNKDLHIGHFSNLVLAKAFQKMGVAEETICILGDTVCETIMQKAEHISKYAKYCKDFDYKVDKIFFASEMRYDINLLKDGEGEYEGTKIFEAGDNKVVMIKKDGATSYFYQDVALASELNDETLYLTGYEQENHFNILKKIFPHVNHIGLGLVKYQTSNKLDAKNKLDKMSTRLGNVIFLKDLMEDLMLQFDGNEKLCYNIFAGYILKNNPQSDKIFNMDTIKNPKNSPGLYLSYTIARLKSAGVAVINKKEFEKQELKFNFIKSKATLNPVHLFNALIGLCEEINSLYVTHHIDGNEENKKMFEPLLSDLVFGMKKIGMFEVDKV